MLKMLKLAFILAPVLDTMGPEVVVFLILMIGFGGHRSVLVVALVQERLEFVFTML